MMTAAQILDVLDDACRRNCFPVLDNGYVFPAATRLSLYRSPDDWAMTIEVFGFSPRARMPDTGIYTFGSRIERTKTPANYVTPEAFDSYVAANPHNEMTFVHPIDALDIGEKEEVLENSSLVLRGTELPVPTLAEIAAAGITPSEPPHVMVFELCRWLAADDRDLVLAANAERRQNIPYALQQIFWLEEWNHPDIAGGKLASNSQAFRQLAAVLETGALTHYRPTVPPNTHWSNWPEGGAL
jgi:hypothetical protein